MERSEAGKWRSLGAYLRQLRLDASVAKGDLAEWLGWDEGQIERLETYPDGLELLQLIDYAQALEADLVQVLRSCKDILRCN